MKKIVILTGAGISQESGLRTFRDGNGLWEQHRIEDVCTPAAFARDPALVHAFYNARRRELLSAHPNAAHEALARLEQAYPSGAVTIVTQNIDDLHERSGSKNVLHMHGELRKLRCLSCGKVSEWSIDCKVTTSCPACTQPSLRPDIVWFGEVPMLMDQIIEDLNNCQLFAAIGTSGQVYPAAGFVDLVPIEAQTVEINLQPTLLSTLFAELRLGLATVEVPRFVHDILQQG